MASNWIKTNKTSGSGSGKFTISASDNSTGYQRSGEVTVSNGDVVRVISVTQYAKPSISRQAPYDAVGYLGGEIRITVQSYAEWWFRSIYDWVTVIDNNGELIREGVHMPAGHKTFTFRLSPNLNAVSRNDVFSIGYLRLDGTEVTDKLRVPTYDIVQSGKTTVVPLPKPSSTEEFQPNNEEVTWEATTEANWITITKSTGTKGEKVEYTVKENKEDESRTGIIKITYTDGTYETIEVRQKGVLSMYDIDIEPENYVIIDYRGGEKAVTVVCETGWTLSSNTQGVVFVPSSGSGNATVNMVVAQNIGDARAIEVTGTSEGGRTDKFTILQAATVEERFNITPSSISTEYERNTVTIEISTNTVWSIYEQPSWINHTIEGNVVTLYIDENTASSERNGNVVFHYGTDDKVFNLPVLQEASLQAIELTASTSYVWGDNAVAYLYVKCKGSWTLAGGGDYVTFDRTSGKGDGTVEVRFNGISSGEKVVLVFIATSSESASVAITYLYEKPYIMLSQNELQLGITGGNIGMKVFSNLDWRARYISRWFTVQPASGNGDSEINIRYNSLGAGENREATITFYNEEYDLYETVILKQNAYAPITVTTDVSTIKADMLGGADFYVTVECTGNWVLTMPEELGYSIDPYKKSIIEGNGNKTLLCYAEGYPYDKSYEIVGESGPYRDTASIEREGFLDDTNYFVVYYDGSITDYDRHSVELYTPVSGGFVVDEFYGEVQPVRVFDDIKQIIVRKTYAENFYVGLNVDLIKEKNPDFHHITRFSHNCFLVTFGYILDYYQAVNRWYSNIAAGAYDGDLGYLNQIDFTYVDNVEKLFEGYLGERVDLSLLRNYTSENRNHSRMFANCPNLVAVDNLSLAFSTPGTSYKQMFENCVSLQRVYVNGHYPDTGGTGIYDQGETIENMSGMFTNCTSLTDVTITITDSRMFINYYYPSDSFNYMFDGCSNLRRLSLNFNFRQRIVGMFNGCNNLTEIHLGTNGYSNDNMKGNVFGDTGAWDDLPMNGRLTYEGSDGDLIRYYWLSTSDKFETPVSKGWTIEKI